MTSLANNFNGISSGTTITTGNSGGTSGNAFGNVAPVGSGATITAQSAAAFEGATGMRIVLPSAVSASATVQWSISGAAGVRVSSSFYFKFAELPTVRGRIATVGSNGILTLNTSGQIEVFDATSTTVARATSTTIPVDTWVYVQLAATVGTTTANGRGEANVFLQSNGSTLLAYDSGATTNLGTGATSLMYFGRNLAATGANTYSYDLVAADNTLTSGFPGTAPTVVVLTNTVAPAITGTPQVGQLLTASTGTWTPTPDSYTYQWKRDGVSISGATSSTYTVATADIGSTLTVTVTAAKATYSSVAATSSPTATVTGGGNIKVYIGSAFVAKPVKAWTGTAWVTKPVKRWNGTAWVTTTY